MASTLIREIRPTGKILGSGSYGEVIEVEWCSTICAAKRMHDIFLRTLSPVELDKMVKDFEKECQIWTSFKHPNIVQLLGIYYPPNSRVPICIMEKMDTSLRHYLEGYSREEFLLPDKVSILCQVAQGLCYLHSQNPPLVHHDLSPNNILLNEWTFQTKLTDFGMTRAINLSKLTRKSSVKGTFAFMPPEALSDPPRYTEKLDVFSFGNCIATILTHEWPNPSHPIIYEGDKVITLTELERRQHLINLIDEKEKKQFLQVISTCLEGNPESRPSSEFLVAEMRKVESTLESTDPSPIVQLCLQKVQLQDKYTAEFRQKLVLQKNLEESQAAYNQQNAQLSLLRHAEASQMEINASLLNDINRVSRENSNLMEENSHLRMLLSDTTKEGGSPPPPSLKSLTAVHKSSRLLRDWEKVCKVKSHFGDPEVPREFRALSVNKDGMIAVACAANGCICLFDGKRKFLKTINVKNGVGKKVQTIYGLAFIKKDQLAISDYIGNSVLIYGISSAQKQATISLNGKPGVLAVTNKGKLYISESSRHCISVYNAEGEFLFEFGNKGSGRGEFNKPLGMCFGPDGLLYVCDYANRRIQAFDEEGNFVCQMNMQNKPTRICVSGDGHVILATEHDHKFYVFKGLQEPSPVSEWKMDSGSYCRGLAINGHGDIFATFGSTAFHIVAHRYISMF